jgi:hypothetical protein
LQPAAPLGRAETVSTAERGRTLGAAPAGAPAASAAPEEPPTGAEVLGDPQLFLELYRELQAERREAWLRQMAAQAAHQRQVEDVVRRLRESAGPEGHEVADRFEAVAYPAAR